MGLLSSMCYLKNIQVEPNLDKTLNVLNAKFQAQNDMLMKKLNEVPVQNVIIANNNYSVNNYSVGKIIYF